MANVRTNVNSVTHILIMSRNDLNEIVKTVISADFDEK